MPKDKIIKYPKQPKFNIVFVILLAVFVYLAVSVYSFFSKEQIVGYEVREGQLVENNRYEAVILRDEKFVLSENTGYINYFVSEKERIGVGGLVYVLDESGAVLDYTQTTNLSQNTLDKDTKSEFRNTLDDFVQKYDRENLKTLYQLENTLQSQTQKLANNLLIQSLKEASGLTGMVKYHYAQNAGNVVFWTDGLEELTAADVTSTLFEKEDYTVTHMYSNNLVAAGETAYKLFDNEKWSIAFMVEDDALAEAYLAEEVVEVTFLKNDLSFWGNVSLVTNTMGEKVVVLDFQSGSVNFLTDRFVEIEISMEGETGLKIPVSAIAQKEFFLVPQEYVVYAEEEDTYYIYMESYTETGEQTLKKIEISPYALKDDKYYLEDVNLTLGARLVKADSSESYAVSEKAALTGVYNINKGYADFSQITVKQQNDTYAIVESDTKYGLSVYDYIVMNAGTVSENDFIYD